MCGRFTLTSTEALDERFAVMTDMLPEVTVSYNTAPGQPILSVIHDGKQRRMGHLRWGLIPRWAKDDKIGYKLINARSETLSQKPSFKKPLQFQRCLIPADGFYEWKQEKSATKQPYRMTLSNGAYFSFAGLWEKWQPPETGQAPVFTCTIITTEANNLLSDIHHRMPVILQPEDEQTWLDPSKTDPDDVSHLLKPFPSEKMIAYPVSKAVNSAKHNSRHLIEQI